MNILSWNCRGSGGTTVATLSRCLHCTKEQIAFISKTRCNSKITGKWIEGLSLCNSAVVGSDGQSGGLWLLWSSEYNVAVKFKNKNVIMAEVQGQREDMLLVGVYGDPSREQNSTIWDLIDSFIEDVDKPTCIVGDFNAIMDLEVKWGGSVEHT